MRLFDTLGMGGQAILAQRRAAQVAGNNVANAATAGYHRQEVVFSPVGHLPHGVEIATLRRAVDPTLARRIQLQEGQTGFADTHVIELGRVESAVGALDETGLAAALDVFFGAWRQLSSAPEDTAVRMEVLAKSEELAARVRTSADALLFAQADVDGDISRGVDEANQLLDEVGRLNRAIATAEASGSVALELRDQQDATLKELSEVAGAVSYRDERGMANVLVEGIKLVQDDAVRHLEVEPDSVTGLQHVYVGDGARVMLDGRLRGGRLGALLEVRDRDLPATLAELDAFAFDLATAVNAVHQANFGLDGLSGRDLFAPPAAVSGAAQSLSVDAAVVGTPDALGAATDPLSVPGDNRGALNLVQIEGQKVAGGGQRTLGGSVSQLLAGVGRAMSAAEAAATEHTDRLDTLETLRQAQSGVSIEEQMLALTLFQRAFEAASRVVTVVDEMLETVVNLK